MGLILWLPLTNNYDNQSLENITYTVGSTVSMTGKGKLGKCPTATTNTVLTYTLNGLSDYLANGKQYTFLCWAKKIQNNDGYLVRLGTNSCGLWFGGMSDENYRWVWNENDNGKRIATVQVSGDFANWVHIGVTIDKTDPTQMVAKYYINGVPSASYNGQITWDGSSKVQPTGNTITISPFYCYYNDIRLYDYCLSTKEIYEIAKGLMVHYTLSNSSGENLVRNTYTYKNWGITNQTSFIDGDSTKIIVFPTVTENKWRECHPNNHVPYSLIRNKTITISCYVKADNDLSCSLNMCIGICASETATSRQKYFNIQKKFTGTGKWEKLIHTIDITDSTFSMGSGTPNFDTGYFIIWPGAWNNYWNGFQMKEYKVELGDHATPWTVSSYDDEYAILGYDDNTEYDVSGLCNNGTRHNITYSNNTARYLTSSVFDGTSSWIYTNKAEKNLDYYLTASIWAYMDDWSTISSPENATQSSQFFSSQEGGGFALFVPTTNYRISFQIGTGTSTNVYKSTTTPTTFTVKTFGSGWHMFTGTYDGCHIKLYIDGVLRASSTPYTEPVPVFHHASNALFLGAESAASSTTPITAGQMFKGNLSDFRLYTTVLSDSDILELYNTSASLSNNGFLFAYELVES